MQSSGTQQFNATTWHNWVYLFGQLNVNELQSAGGLGYAEKVVTAPGCWLTETR